MAGWMLDDAAIAKLATNDKLLNQLYRTLVRRLEGNRSPAEMLLPRRQRFLNNSGEECPAYAVMEVTAGVRGGANAYTEERLTITKPTSTFNRLYLVNGPQAVAADKEGEGTWLMDDAAGRPVLYASGDGTPAWGESWGAKASQWTLAKNRPGFLVTGANNTSATNPYTSGVQYIVNQLKGKPTANIAKGAAGTVTIWLGTTTPATASMTISARATGIAVVQDKFVSLAWSDEGWECGCWET